MTDLSGSDLAAAMIAEAQGGEKKPKKLNVATVAAVAILTLVAVAGGTGVGIVMAGRQPAAPAQTAHPPEAEDPAEVAATGEAVKGEKAPILVPLKQTITTLSSPARTLVRLDAALLVRPGEDANTELLAAQVQADTLAFLRTVDLVQIEGARGLTHLREDLRERARMRSPAVSDYLVQSLVVE